MKTEVKKYAYRVIWSEEDQEFVGLCAEFPGLSWLEPDPDDALKGIRSVVKECVDDMVRTGEDVPLPISTREYSSGESICVRKISMSNNPHRFMEPG